MKSKESIQSGIDALRQKYGEWTYDIPLPHGVFTKGGLNVPHTRLKRLAQIVHDLCEKPLKDCRILDLACLDGMFSIEFASRGAQTVGIEIREANIKKAIFCKEALQLENLSFIQDDVRNIELESLGAFDAILCSGILYHLTAGDVFKLIQKIFRMCTRLVVIDTHIAFQAEVKVTLDGVDYWGKEFVEHLFDDTAKVKAAKLWAAWDNSTSFWFTRPSLINMLSNAGFSSVYECFIPAHINFGKPGLECRDRCTFVAIKDDLQELVTSPAANTLKEKDHHLRVPSNAQSDDKNGRKAVVHASFTR
jgi:hypothetical protein